jgi:tetratricopeptide (TPR) repeat protein
MTAALATAQDNFGEELNLGTQAFRQARYDEAIRHFQNAASIRPQNEFAHLHLAAAYAQQYIPGVETPENLDFGKAAIAEYQKVLEINPKSPDTLKGLAYLYLQMKKFVDAKSFLHSAIDADSSDPEAYYTMGVIDWTQSYSPRMERREKLGLKPDDPFPINASACWELKDSNQAFIKEGMEMLAKALELRPDYDDAMAYMNLLYRERAEIQCGDPPSRAADLKAADHWVDLTMSTKKAKQKEDNKESSSPTEPH